MQRVQGRVRYQPFLSFGILRANWHFLRHRPRRYLRAVRRAFGAALGSLNFTVGALGIFPKSVRFAYEMERRGIDHVHAHFATHPALAALIVGELTGIPFSFTAHGSDIHVDQRGIGHKLAAAAFAVTVSDYNRRFLAERVGAELARKLRVLHCGVDTTRFSPRSPEPAPAGEPFRFACVASFRRVKGHPVLLEACRLLKDRGVAFECHLIGDGGTRGEIEAAVRRLGLESEVQLHGALPQHEVQRRMRGFDCAVLASVVDKSGRREGIPVSLMEAMAVGLPVVASHLSGIPELIEDGREGLLVPPGDAERFAGALERLARSPELRRRFGEAGRRKVEADFELGASAEKLAALIRGARPRRSA